MELSPFSDIARATTGIKKDEMLENHNMQHLLMKIDTCSGYFQLSNNKRFCPHKLKRIRCIEEKIAKKVFNLEDSSLNV